MRAKQKNRKFSAVTGYSNNNQDLLSRFRQDFSKIFNVKMKMRKNVDVCIRSIKIYSQLNNQFGNFGSRKWKIHSSIKNSKKEIKVEWLKAFF
jgi:hypothetical protein